LSSPWSDRSSENRKRGGKLIFVCEAAIDLARTLDFMARRLIAGRQLSDDDEVPAPAWADVPFVGKGDELAAWVNMR
jgi:hypothetical protein